MRMVPAYLEDILSGRTFYEQKSDKTYDEVELSWASYGTTMGGEIFGYKHNNIKTGEVNNGNIYIKEHSLEKFHEETGSTPQLWVDANTRINSKDEKSALELLIRLDIIIDSCTRSKAEKHICNLVDHHPDGVIGVLNDGYKLGRTRYMMHLNDDGSLTFKEAKNESYILKAEHFLTRIKDLDIVKDITENLVKHREMSNVPAMSM